MNNHFESLIPDDARHFVIHLRNADDVQALIDENKRLQDELKKRDRDIAAWLTTGLKYHDCLDELKEIRAFLKKKGLSWRFRNI